MQLLRRRCVVSPTVRLCIYFIVGLTLSDVVLPKWLANATSSIPARFITSSLSNAIDEQSGPKLVTTWRSNDDNLAEDQPTGGSSAAASTSSARISGIGRSIPESHESFKLSRSAQQSLADSSMTSRCKEVDDCRINVAELEEFIEANHSATSEALTSHSSINNSDQRSFNAATKTQYVDAQVESADRDGLRQRDEKQWSSLGAASATASTEITPPTASTLFYAPSEWSSALLLTFQTSCTPSSSRTPFQPGVDGAAKPESEHSLEAVLIAVVSHEFGVQSDQLKVISDGVTCDDRLLVIISSFTKFEGPRLEHSILNRSFNFEIDSPDGVGAVHLRLTAAVLLRNESTTTTSAMTTSFITSYAYSNATIGSQLHQLFDDVTLGFLIVLFAIIGTLAISTGAISAGVYVYLRRKCYSKFNVRNSASRYKISRVGTNMAVSMHHHDIKLRDVIAKSMPAVTLRPQTVNRTKLRVHSFEADTSNSSIRVNDGIMYNDIPSLWSLSRSASISRCLQTFSSLPEVHAGIDDDARSLKSPITISSFGTARDLHDHPNLNGGLKTTGSSRRSKWKANPVFVDRDLPDDRFIRSVLNVSHVRTDPALVTSQLRFDRPEKTTFF